jgi:hypothetical protein
MPFSAPKLNEKKEIAKMICNNREYKPLKVPLGLTLLAIRFAFMTPSSMNYLQ